MTISLLWLQSGGYCKDPAMGHLLRCLFFLEARFDLVLTATLLGWIIGLWMPSLGMSFTFFCFRSPGAAGSLPSAQWSCGPSGPTAALDVGHLEELAPWRL